MEKAAIPFEEEDSGLNRSGLDRPLRVDRTTSLSRESYLILNEGLKSN